MISLHLSCESAVAGILSPEENQDAGWLAGVGWWEAALCRKGLSPGQQAVQEHTGASSAPTVTIPNPSQTSAPPPPPGKQGTVTAAESTLGQRGRTKAGGEDGQGVIGTAGRKTSHCQVCLQALNFPGEITAPSVRCSGKRSQIGTILAMPRQTNLPLIPLRSLTITQSVDKETQCVAFLQGNCCAGPGPGPANTCEQTNSKMYSHRLAPLRLGSQRFIKRNKDKEVSSC